MKIRMTAWLPWALFAVVVIAALFSLTPTLTDAEIHADIFDFATAVLDALLGCCVWRRRRVDFVAPGAQSHRLAADGHRAVSIAVGGTLLVYLARAMSSGAAAPTLLTYLLMWLNGWTWWLLIGPLLLILLLFPTGQWLSPRWRLVAGMIALLFLYFIGVSRYRPSGKTRPAGTTLPNPLGVSVLPADLTFETIEAPWIIARQHRRLVRAFSLDPLSPFRGRWNVNSSSGSCRRVPFFIAAYATTGLSSIGKDQPNWAGVWLNLAFILLPVRLALRFCAIVCLTSTSSSARRWSIPC